ncbi:MAG: isoprenyl transferase [Clostridia bacterium]
MKSSKLDQIIIPKHIAIIMDGNGRWAKKRGLPRKVGHKYGADNFKKITRYCNKIGVQYLTVYAFSTENWKRPQDEVKAIMDLFREYLNNISKYREENVVTRFIGDKTNLDDDIIQLMENAEKESENATGLVLNIAINYGGRLEICSAVNNIINNNPTITYIDEEMISKNLDTKNQPDPDIIIRPSGEFRLSNFLIWQSAYSEFVFFDVLWPDFKEKHIDLAVKQFNKRDRRFGGI